MRNRCTVADVKYEIVTVCVAVSREQRGGRSELVFSFHLLLCCIEYVIRLTPSFQLKPPFGMLVLQCVTVVCTRNIQNTLSKYGEL